MYSAHHDSMAWKWVRVLTVQTWSWASLPPNELWLCRYCTCDFYPLTTFDSFGIGIFWQSDSRNLLEAATQGASSSISLVANITVNLIAFLALLSFMNSALSWLGSMFDYPQLSFEVQVHWAAAIHVKSAYLCLNITLWTALPEFLQHTQPIVEASFAVIFPHPLLPCPFLCFLSPYPPPTDGNSPLILCLESRLLQTTPLPLYLLMLVCGCHRKPEAGLFVKKRGLCGSRFWGLKVQDRVAAAGEGEELLCAWWEGQRDRPHWHRERTKGPDMLGNDRSPRADPCPWELMQSPEKDINSSYGCCCRKWSVNFWSL